MEIDSRRPLGRSSTGRREIMFFLMLLAELSVVHLLGGLSVCLVSGLVSGHLYPDRVARGVLARR